MQTWFFGLHLGVLFLYAQLTVLNGSRTIGLHLNRASALHLNLAVIADSHLGRDGAGLASDSHRPDINFDNSCCLHFKIHRQRCGGTEGEGAPEHDQRSSSFLALLASWRFITKIPHQLANSLTGF